MKRLLLAGAVMAAVGCQSEAPTPVVREPKMSAEPGRSHRTRFRWPTVPAGSERTRDEGEGGVPVASPPTTEAPPPETTTTTVPPEPILCPGYSHPLHHLSCVDAKRSVSTVVRSAPAELPSPQSRTVRPATGGTPPDYVKQCESGGSYTAVNPNGHYGAWQFSQSTWESVGGTGRPDHASPAEQDRRAAILWDGGSGASHWECA